VININIAKQDTKEIQMTSSTPQAPMVQEAQGWFNRAEAWLDARGKGAWIAAMVLGFILFWPIGLALLAYMIWSKRMFNGSCGKSRHMTRHKFRTSGNTRLRRLQGRHAAPAGRGTGRVRGLPPASARRQGQVGIRPVHGRTPPALRAQGG
jgi:hypothetical protein